MCLLLYAFFGANGYKCLWNVVVFHRIYRGRLKLNPNNLPKHYFDAKREKKKKTEKPGFHNHSLLKKIDNEKKVCVCNENGVSSFYMNIEKLSHDVGM